MWRDLGIGWIKHYFLTNGNKGTIVGLKVLAFFRHPPSGAGGNFLIPAPRVRWSAHQHISRPSERHHHPCETVGVCYEEHPFSGGQGFLKTHPISGRPVSYSFRLKSFHPWLFDRMTSFSLVLISDLVLLPLHRCKNIVYIRNIPQFK